MAAVTSPNLGLIFDRPPINIPSRGLRDGKNFRCKNGTLESRNLGWERFSQNFTLNGPVNLIDNFFPRGLDEKLIFGTATDLYLYNPGDPDSVIYLTPRYDTGTASNSGTSVTGSGTLWLANAKIGDEIMFGSAAYLGTNPSGNDANTKALLHMNGADAATTFTDTNAGGSPHTWTANGNAQLDTADKKFGTASGLFDGTGDYVSTPDHADYALGSGAFSIDLWFKVGAGSDGVAMDMAGKTDAGLGAAGSEWHIRRTNLNQIVAQVSNGSAFVSLTDSGTYTVATNPGWHHVELTRSSNTLYLFVDGVQKATASISGSVPDTAEALMIGARNAAGLFWLGWLDEFRMSVGVARHTANFTVKTEEYYTQWYNISAVGGDTSITLNPGTGLTWDLQPYTIRKKFTMTVDDYWSFDTFVNDGTSGDDLWFATNGRDSVVTWDGVATQVTLHPELLFTCKTLTTYSNMMIYANLLQGGDIKHNQIINSDVGLPLNAGATGTGLSEQFVAYNGTDEILNMIPLGDYLVIYAERTIVPVQFIGDPLIFLFRVAISGVGPISPNALADFGDFHEFLGSDAGYIFDGVTLKETNSHVWRDILRQADPARRRQAFGHFDEEQGDLIWSIPGNSDAGVGTEGQPAEIAWPEHYLEDPGDALDGSPFSKRDFPFTITGFYQRETGLTWDQISEQWQEFNFAWNDQFFQAAFPLNLAGSYDGNIWVVNQVQTANGAVLPSFVRTGRMVTGDGRERNLLTRIYPFARPFPYNLEVNLYMGDHVAGEPVSKGQQLFDMNLVEGGHFVTFYRRGRVMEFKYGSSVGDPWVLDGWDYDLRKGGRR